MSSEQINTEPDTGDINAWQPFEQAYADFVQANPMLGLGLGDWACINLRRNYGKPLLEAGAVLRLTNGRWLAHRAKFGPALFEAITRGPAEIVERAQARGAATKRRASGAKA